MGYGFDGGVLFPDEAFESTFTLDGFGEFYLTPRVSVRGMLAWASPGVDGRTEDHFRQVKLLFGGQLQLGLQEAAAVCRRRRRAPTSSG